MNANGLGLLQNGFLVRICLSLITMVVMKDLELVDYSSDHLEAQDVWGVPAGGLREVLEGFPRLGPEGTGTTGLGMERPVYDFSPSYFLAFSPPRLSPDESEVFSGLKVDLIGSSSWKEAGDFFS